MIAVIGSPISSSTATNVTVHGGNISAGNNLSATCSAPHATTA